MKVKISDDWAGRLEAEFNQPYFSELVDFVKQEYATHTIFPQGKDIFKAFDGCSFNALKVVILGQDPYHGPGQAHGLCFSVQEGVPKPPSLKNIFKEIHNDLGNPIPDSGNLENWAAQGVLLLNATLTVRQGQPGSHQNKGWEAFTDAVIKLISEQKQGIVFLLWGAYAQKKGAIIDTTRHYVLTSPHPSPFSADRGFFGCQHFSKTNKFLLERGQSEISW